MATLALPIEGVRLDQTRGMAGLSHKSSTLAPAKPESVRQRAAALGEDVLLVTLIVYSIPVAIILFALPVVVAARLVLEIASRL